MTPSLPPRRWLAPAIAALAAVCCCVAGVVTWRMFALVAAGTALRVDRGGSGP